jgi:hypothetical protein
LILAVALLLFGAMLLLGCGDDDNPTGPSNNDEESLTDYRVWFTDVGRQDVVMLYEYHPTTRSLDSMALPWMHKGGFRVSADGSLLFFGSKIFDPESGQQVGQLPYPLRAVSLDGEYLACSDGGFAVVLRTSDYSVAFRDRTVCGGTWMGFPSDGPFLWMVSEDSSFYYGSVVEMEPVADSFAVTNIGVPGAQQVIRVPGGRKWLRYGKAPFGYYTWVFSVYDTSVDSLVFEYYHEPGAADVAISPDGRYAYFGNPGNLLAGPGPPPFFKVFDIQANDIVQTVWLDSVVNGVELMEPKSVGDIVITPDGRWLVTLNAIPGLQLRLYDLKKQAWVDYKSFGTHNVYLAHLAVQSAL